MFTGIIKEVGSISSIRPNKEGAEITITCPLLSPDISIDDSIATNGICLTATQKTSSTFTAQAVHVTLQKTAMKNWKVGQAVNLELATRPTDRLGGHLVQGHVNGVGELVAIKPTGKNYLVDISIPWELERYTLKEGSIALDGISLTIAHLNQNIVTVSLIPHTWENTHFHTKKVGDLINIEVDIIAKYIEKLLRPQTNNTMESRPNLADLLQKWD